MMPQSVGLDVNVLAQRLRRLATLDTTVFDEVRTDASASISAILVVAVSVLLSGLGGWLWWIFGGYPNAGDIFVRSMIIGSIIALGLWVVWVAMVYVVLAQIFRARLDMYELGRVMGFAAAPLSLGVLMCVHRLDFGIGLAVLALLFGTNQIAIQSSTDASPAKVLVANAAGFAVWAIVLNLLVTAQNAYAPGVFIFAPVG